MTAASLLHGFTTHELIYTTRANEVRRILVGPNLLAACRGAREMSEYLDRTVFVAALRISDAPDGGLAVETTGSLSYSHGIADEADGLAFPRLLGA